MQVLTTIIPIFVVILLGWVARKRGFIQQDFLQPANRLVYYLSIPALMFSSITKARFHEQFDGKIIALTLLAAALVYGGAHLYSRLRGMPPGRAGSYIQCSGHGNQGYIGLPITLYYLGEAGLASAAIISGFLMILQNLLSVIGLQLHVSPGRQRPGGLDILKKIAANPVIIGAMSGIIVSALQLPVPLIVRRSLDIIGALAPPMALLLIGASLSVQLMRRSLRGTLGVIGLKLLVLPALGLTMFLLFGVPSADYLPALIMLCAPTATVAYVMGREMHGDPEFAVVAITGSTLLSALTFVGWLTLVSVLHL